MVGEKTDKVVGKKTSTPTPITVVDVAMGTRAPETVLLLTATCKKCRVTAWPHKTVNLQTKKSTPALRQPPRRGDGPAVGRDPGRAAAAHRNITPVPDVD